MVAWILAVLALFVAQTLLAPSLRYYGGREGRRERLLAALGPRDAPPPMPQLGERAHRALLNLFEALPVFLTVALLLVMEGKADSLARAGAATFFAARSAYVPSYMFGPPGLRSGLWVVGWVGLAIMLVALLR
jgi:uncharacterized MAPEG superfamily protein